MSEQPEIVGRSRDRVCYQHPDRRGGVTCQRCDRPICPECMHQASVGFHCPECTAAHRSKSIPGVRHAPSGQFKYRATRVLLGLNVAAFLYSVAVSGSAQGITRLDSDVLIDGGLFAEALVRRGTVIERIGVDAGEYYRLVTSAFLHDGIFHLAFNMYALWLLGQLLESGFGASRFVSLYVVSMFGGAAGVMLWSPDSPTVGASGAVYGLMGAMVVVQRAIGGNLFRSGLGTLLIINLALTLLVPRISIGGHFGGLAAGVLMGVAMFNLEKLGAKKWLTVALGAAISAIFVTASVIGASGVGLRQLFG